MQSNSSQLSSRASTPAGESTDSTADRMVSVHENGIGERGSGPYSNYYPNLNIVPSSLRDIISVMFVLLSLPCTVSVCLLFAYLVVIENLPVLHRIYTVDNSWGFWLVGFSVVKHVIVNGLVYYGLTHVVYNKWFFNYIVILSKSIISNHLIGSTTFNFYNSISTKKILSKDHYSSHFINSLISFFMIIYINYVCTWLNLTTKFEIINNRNYSELKIQVYIILCLNIITNELYKKKDYFSYNIYTPCSTVSVNCDTNKLITVDISSTSNRPTHSSNIALSNFNTFIFSPFKTKIIMLKRKLLPTLLTPVNDTNSSGQVSTDIPATTTTTSISRATSTSLTTTIKAPHITTVENTIVIQPFWSILAACKALWTNSNVFKGNSTIHKNNGGKFIHKDIENMVKMATVKINDSQIILRFLDINEFLTLSSASNLRVKLNNIDWSFFKLFQTNDKAYLIIYGLTPHFQYEIEVENNDVIINRLIINTTNNNSAIVESIAESSTLSTLQTSLLSTRENLFAFKNKFKKFKKEENKKISEVKNNIDNLKSKLSKYNNKPINDNRIFGKLKSLQHSVSQLETEIEQLKLQIDQLSKQEVSDEKSFKQSETKYLQEIGKLNDIMSQYESRINETKKALKQASNEQVSLKQKHDKLLHKHQTKGEEIKQLNAELKAAKKEITSKFSKRIKKIQENYEVVLPNVVKATERLNAEYEALLDSKEYHEQP